MSALMSFLTTATRLVLLITLAAVLLIAALALLGCALPRDARLVAEQLVRAPPEATFRAIADFDSHPVTGALCLRVEWAGGTAALPCWVERQETGLARIVTTEAEPPVRMARKMTDPETTMHADFAYELTPAAEAGGTLVRLTQIVHVPYEHWAKTPLLRLLVRFYGSMGMRTFLRKIDASLNRPGS